ncbi:vegetative cell wall protein gp1-like [Amphibalanus amphitrite]|uniref:vegetative cell wall protein gp1-like n=1 Tax=Amphibalanus amphitrite TaxID=1232801 RepID=UPI001C8FEBE6|nr:vegetative cell wall protein gp1-like [Amphibalanus amphitrite]
MASAASGAASRPADPAALQQPWLEGQLLVLPSPLPLHVHCPLAGCPRSYANQVQTAVRHSLLRHLRTDFHPGTSECHWCRKWFTTRRGLLNHRARCPRRPPPAPPQPTDWAAALARLRAETAPAAGAPARPATPTSPEMDLSLSPPPPPPGQGRPSPSPEPTPPPAPEEDRLSPPPSPGPLTERWWSPTQPSPEEPTSPPLVFPAPSSDSETPSPPSLLERPDAERRPAADGGELRPPSSASPDPRPRSGAV